MSYHSIEFEQTECPNCSKHSIPFKKNFKCPYCGYAIDVYYDFVSEVVKAMLCHKEMYGSFFPDAWFSGPIAEQIEGEIFNFFDELEERKLERTQESIIKMLDVFKYESEKYKQHFKEIVLAVNDQYEIELKKKNKIESHLTKTTDKIDPRKVKANMFILESESFAIAEAYSKRDKEKEELLKFSTQSIKKIDQIGGIPLGFSLEFVATYPDVLLWWNSLSDEKTDNLLKDFDEKDLLDENQKIKLKYLTIIIEAYKNTGATLECSCGISE